jgi:hypothetical protein
MTVERLTQTFGESLAESSRIPSILRTVGILFSVDQCLNLSLKSQMFLINNSASQLFFPAISSTGRQHETFCLRT